MTVSYQSDVASSTSGGLIRLLWRWRGSVWKLVYKELLLFLFAYAILAFSYDFIFPDSVKRLYEKIVIVCSAFVDMIPLSFILGFYVSFTASRWWHQYTAIPWPDKIMNNIAMYIPGVDEDSRILRRTLMRYLNLTLVLVLRSISIAVKRRFPTKEHLVEAGFMTKPELEMFSAVPATEFNTFWIPCTWFVNLLRDARQECRITDSSGLKLIMEEFNEFRSKCGLLWSYDWVSIPLVYTQVVTLSTYAFFVASVFGRQHINPPKYPDLFLTEIEHRGEFYIPVFTILQFLLYMGLLKLGEQLINPFGDDDEDFELNWIIDRHIKVSFLGVDVLNGNPPPIMKDNYFDESDIKLPYTAAAVSYKKKTYRGSMATYHVPSEQQGLVVPDFEEDDDTQEPDHQSLLKTDARSRDSSLWSMIGSKVKQASASILSLDSENLEALDERTSELGWHSTLSLSPQEIAMGEIAQANGRGGGHRESTGDFDTSDDLNYPSGENSRGRDRLDSLTLFKKRSQLAAPIAAVASDSSSNLQLYQEPLQQLQPQQPQQQQQQQQQQSQLQRQQSSDKLAPFDPTLGFFSSMFPSKESTARKSSSASASVSKEALATLTPNLSRSSSNASKTLPHAMPRLPRAAIIKLRKADPKLTIRPFRSKVTFSEDTKGAPTSKTTGGVTVDRTAGVTSSPKSIYHVPMAKPSRGMRQEGLDLTISSPELSEADLLAAYIEHRDNTIRAGGGSTRSSALLVPPLSPLRTNKPPPLATIVSAHRQQQSTDSYPPDGSSTAASTGATSPSSSGAKTSSPLGIRKSSLGSEDVHSPLYPADLINAIGLPSEYWLRHQSLPNIQEICEDVSSTASGPVPSPTARSPFKRTSPTAVATSPATSEVSRGSIRRQVAQDKPSPPKDVSSGSKASLGLTRGGSSSSQMSAAEEKRRRYSSNTNNSGGSGNSLGSHSSNTAVGASGASLASSSGPTSSRRYRKKGSSKPASSKSLHSLASGSTKQSSTESEGSFVTAKSYYIQISEEDENQHAHHHHHLHHHHQHEPPGAGASVTGSTSSRPSSKCDLCHQQVSSSPSLGDDSTTITPSSTLSGKSTKPSLIDLKKSSHSTSSSVASYSSAKDIFFKFPPSSSLDSSPSGSSNLQQQQQQSNINTNSLSIPTIVVMKSSPSSVSSNNQQPPHHSQSPSTQLPLNQPTQLDVSPEQIIDSSQNQRGNGSRRSEQDQSIQSTTVDSQSQIQHETSSSSTESTSQVTTSTNSSPSNLT